ncbi:MAG: histidine kinase N-terminal 7TM domain-containing protein, partial [Halobacteriales archaeon]|nr:histidine kinase N-terminal 7TM domain-containing protein [Halobacteriales archaeon]
MTTLDLLTAVLLGTIAVGATAAFLAWRERHEPGAKPLLAMLLGQVWWSAFLVFQLNAATLEAKAQWVDLSWIGVVVIPVAWLLFALEYTGRDRFVRPRYVALLSVIPVITVVLTLTGDYHQLMYLDSRLVDHAGREYIVRSGGPWFWVVAVYTYVLGILGAIPLLGLITSDAVPFRGQSIAILIGLVTPWGINLAHIAGVSPIPGVDPTPIGFAISGVAYLGAVMRFRLFGTNPAPTFNARRLVFDQMQDAAVVVDSHDFVVHMNESAVEAFGQEPREVLGNEAWKTIPQYHTLPEAGSPSGYLTIQGEAGEREYDVTVTRITDAYGRLTGRLITFHDIGEFLRQQQRLEVLNRVLRHNIRTETNIIYGYADFVGEDDSDEMA